MTDSAHEIWLLDISGSMGGTRIKLLREAVKKYKADAPHVRLAGFANGVVPINSLNELDAITPNGGTNLHLALEHAAELMCGKVIVFTDGEPADEEACYIAASKVPGVVDTIFCGDQDDREARRFCDRLARDNGGQFVAKDIMKGQSLLCAEVRSILGLPAPIAL